VSEICGELKAIGPVLVKLKHEAVYHTDATLPIGAEKAPADFWFQPEGETCLVGVFRDAANTRYLMGVNHGAEKARELTLRFREPALNVELMDRVTGKWRALTLENTATGQSLKLTLAPGDGELLRVITR
jgi:hypothetical protein